MRDPTEGGIGKELVACVASIRRLIDCTNAYLIFLGQQMQAYSHRVEAPPQVLRFEGLLRIEQLAIRFVEERAVPEANEQQQGQTPTAHIN